MNCFVHVHLLMFITFFWREKITFALVFLTLFSMIRTKNILVVDSVMSSPSQYRKLAELTNHPYTFLFSSTTSASEWTSEYDTSFSPMQVALPPNIRLETLKTRENGQVLLRLAHIFEIDEDPDYSVSILNIPRN